MGYKWYFTVFFVLLTHGCMSLDRQEPVDTVQDLPEIANEPEVETQAQTDLRKDIKSHTEVKELPHGIDCQPDKPLIIEHQYTMKENDVLVWTMNITPDFFYATKWTKDQKCEEFTSYTTMLNQTTRDTERKCAQFIRSKTNCATLVKPTIYQAILVSPARIRDLYKKEVIYENGMKAALRQLGILTSLYSTQRWLEYPNRKINTGAVIRMLKALHNKDRSYIPDILYETRPYYCMADCTNRAGTDAIQCQGYATDPKYGYARNFDVASAMRYGMQLDNEGTPCKSETPCTKNYYKDNYCNGGYACAVYGHDQYGRKCKTVHKGSKGTYCYVENPKSGEWSWGWTHPAIDVKRGAYCYIG